MSRLPRSGGGAGCGPPKIVKSTSTRTMTVPGTNKTVTQTQTTINEVKPCPTDAATVSRGRSGIVSGAPGRCPPPAPCGNRPAGGSGLTPGSAGRGLRPASAPVGASPKPGPSGGRGSCGICGPGQPGMLAPPRPMGTPMATSSPAVPSMYTPGPPSGMRPQGTPSGLRPPSGVRPPSGLRPPSAGLRPPGTAQQRSVSPITPIQGGPCPPCGKSVSGIRPPGGRPTPSPAQVHRPPSATGLRPPSATGLRPPSAPGLRPPSASPGLRPPSTPGLRSPATPRLGLPPSQGRQPTPIKPQTQGAGPCPGPCAAAGRAGQGGRPGGDPGRQVAETSIEEEVQKELMNKSSLAPDKKVSAKSGRINRAIPELLIDTPGGPEKVIQQAVLEKRVERDEEGERIVKNLSIIDTDKRTGQLKKIEMGLQQMDPKFAKDQGKEVIGIVSKVSITPSYTTVTQECTRATTETLPQAANMTLEEIANLIDQEKEDVENTLKMLPPDLELQPGKIEMKRRLQTLRLNSESMALLEQSIINPEPIADETQEDPSPEMMAAMMHTVEKGVPPQSAPEQVFNALFTETTNERFIQLSPVTQGPLQDVVIPTKLSYDVQKEVVCAEIEILTEKLQNVSNVEDIPPVDIFTRIMDDMQKSPTKGKIKEKTFPQISDEKSLWVNANLEHLVNIIGADPVDVLDPANVEELETSGTLEHEMSIGIEYYIDVDPVQYMSRVQLRGTQEPNYFPGYLVALPEFPETIKLARSPDEVLASAWKSVQPKYFQDESMQSMLY